MAHDSDPPSKDDPPQKPRGDRPDMSEERKLHDPFATQPPPRDPFGNQSATEPEILPPEGPAEDVRETAPLRDLVRSYREEARRSSAAEPGFGRPPAAGIQEPPPSGRPLESPVETEAAPAEKGRRGWFGRRKTPASPPPPPPPNDKKVRQKMSRSERSRSTFVSGANAALTILFLILLGSAVLVHYGIKQYDTPGPLQAETDVAVPRGSGPRDIADRLQQAGAIDGSNFTENLFLAAVQVSGKRAQLKAGEYRIPAHASMREIMDMMVEGKVVEHRITIPEGRTSKQIVTQLLGETILTGTVRDVPPEGSLLPETYQVTRGTNREDILKRMAAAQEKVLAEVWAARDPDVPVKTPQELVTLASIVEKETGVASERPRVASVFVNRLNRKMRLQSDPTIIYGLVQGAGTLGRPILRSEILKPTPYNTYTIAGLPPGPIANPGRASLEAAAKPAETKDLYFVADGSGGHAFAASLAEHNANVRRWRAIERAAATDRAPADAVPVEGTTGAPAN